MRITVETLQMQISRLKQLITECPTPDENVALEIKHILQTAPKILQDAEGSIQSGNPLLVEQVHEMLKETGVFIEWAVGSVKGKIQAEKVMRGESVDSSLPADKRFLDRIFRYMLTKIDGPTYMSLVREFAGDDAVQGTTIHMDPASETEAFSQWIIYDIPSPGENQRLIELFGQEESCNLPDDEQVLLELHLADRPSIYKVVDSSPKHQGPNMQGVYSVKDMLSENDIIQIWDVSTSKTLQKDAIFVGRAIPVDTKATYLFNLLGTVTELPPNLWAILSEFITGWSDEYCAQNQSSTTRNFFRAHHARIRRKILEITEGHKASRPKAIKISSMKIKTASDIHTFVKRTLKKGGGDERLMHAPDTLKYMNKFKRLMDTSSNEEMDYLSNKFKGFNKFGKMLESLAMAIGKGDIEVP